MKITEELLEAFDFEKVEVSKEESGDEAYYYYAIYLMQDEDGYAGISLLTCASDEVVDGNWDVTLLDGNRKIKDAALLTTFIMVCKDIEKGN